MGTVQESGRADGVGPATPEEIRELPRRYAIGKRPLSRLLGWGELTYTRLLNGGVPNEAHSEEIRRLLDDPAAYARVLELGREHKVITGVAYEKSRRAVDALLAEGGHDEAGDPLKIFAVADRICALTGGEVTPHALQMLMHVAQERSREAAGADGELLFSQEATEVEWGWEYPQISAGYPFDAIQLVAQRMGDVEMVVVDEPAEVAEADASLENEVEAAASIEAEAAPEPEPDPSKKKGKKDKKEKGKKKDKAKGKKGKKGKGVAEAEAAEIAAAALEPEPTPEPEQAPEPAPKPAPKPAANGPLSPAECALVDKVVAAYLDHLSAAFA